MNYTVNFTGFATPAVGATYIRCRLAFVAGEVANPTGAAASGEVEDYRIDQALAATLASFNAAAQSDHVLVTWETVSELNNAGFNLYRSLSANGELSLLGYLPSPTPGSSVGAAYSYQDFDVATGQTYWYWLEAVDLSGATTMYEPVVVTFQIPTAVTVSELTTTEQRDDRQPGLAGSSRPAGGRTGRRADLATPISPLIAALSAIKAIAANIAAVALAPEKLSARAKQPRG